MATYDLQEQEQIDALKHFWRENGRIIITGVLAFVIGVGGVQGWKLYKRDEAESASAQYIKLEEAVAKNDVNEIRNVGESIVADYGDTTYASMAALVMAKAERDAGDLDASAQRLEFAVENAGDGEIGMIARLRLALVRLDQERHDDALKLLDSQVTEAFVPVYANARGDILFAQGKVAEARAAYQQALDETEDTPGSWRDVVQIKLDALSE